ncbi:LacI family DNA-binding transcriptional regulator [Kitasatospora sp. NPDC048365]|uniref:LacI family DNA-binding transcriptional regulator n=1 Tax=Kitasatospora sp. NPDC048365 TaxID=3364050 RepID=UPI0037207946
MTPPGPEAPGGPPAASGGRRPTGRDVARLAGVSQAAVSLVLSGGDTGHRVSDATRQRIREAADALGYRPQAAGRQLRLGRSGMVLLAVPNLLGPFFGRVLTGVHAEAGPLGLAVVVSSGWDAATLADAAATGRFDGLLICSPDDSQLGGLPADTPAVLLDADPARHPDRPTVELDMAGGMRAAVGHLAALGHRRIGHLRSTLSAHTFRVRHAAFESAAAGLEVLEVGVPLNEGAPAGVAAGRALLARPDRPHAVLCDDDVLASGLYRAAAELGLRIPEDLSVAGIDNIPIAELLAPPLTTVDLPGEALGRAGVTALAALLRGTPPPAVPPLETRLIVRGSTAPAG